MSDAAANPEEVPAKSGKKSLILAVVLALVGAGGGFYAVSSGLILTGQPTSDGSQVKDGSEDKMTAHDSPGIHAEMPTNIDDIAFVEVDQITISLSEGQAVRHLRFRAQLEINADYKHDVVTVLPRVTDVMNSYLRAIELDDLTGPLALIRLRAQLLRRIQLVTGKGQVKDLLIMEFVLN